MGTLDEELVGESVGKGMEQEDLGRLAVAPRATGFLIVGLERSRHGVVHDDAHVRLVDAHPERVRGNDGANVAIHEGGLDVVAMRIVEPGVIGERRDARPLQGERHLLHVATSRRIDDRHALMVAEHADQRLILLRVGLRGDDVIPEVRPVEPGDDRLRVLQPKLPRDVGTDVRCRGGGERNGGRPTESLAHLRDPEVARPEVVSPFAYAMRLVDGQQRHAHVLEPLGRTAEVKSLRRHVEHLDLAAHDARHPLCDFGGGQGAVQERGGDAAGGEGVNLVLHQRNQRAHDYREARQDERRHLIADGLAPAGRKDNERIATSEHRGDRALLSGTKVGKAETGAEDVARGSEGGALGGHAQLWLTRGRHA